MFNLAFLTKAFTTIKSIYSFIKDSNFKSEVLDALNAIEAELQKIEALIAAVKSSVDMGRLQDATDQAESTINGWYKADNSTDCIHDWLDPTKDVTLSPQLSEDIKTNGEKCLKNIHGAIMGTLQSGLDPWMSIFKEDLDVHWEKQYSKCETTYLYFYHLVSLQLKCFAAMSAIDDPLDYETALPANLTDQGKFVKSYVDGLVADNAFDAIFNSGVSDTKYRINETTKVKINGYGGVPEGNVVYSFGINMDVNGVFILHIKHGILNANGWITPATTNNPVYSSGNEVTFYSSVANGGYLGALPATSPRKPGYVIIDMTLTQVEISNWQEGGYTVPAIVLKMKIAPVSITTTTDSTGNEVEVVTIETSKSEEIFQPGTDANYSSPAGFIGNGAQEGAQGTHYFDSNQYEPTGDSIPPLTDATWAMNVDIIRNIYYQDFHKVWYTNDSSEA